MAQSSNPAAPEPVVLNDEQTEYPLGLHLQILEDPSGSANHRRGIFPRVQLAICPQPG